MRLAILVIAALSIWTASTEAYPRQLDQQSAIMLLIQRLEGREADASSVPRLNNPEDAALFSQALNFDALPEVGRVDIVRTMPTCVNSTNIGIKYLLIGIRIREGENESPEILAAMNRNALLYQDETARAMQFTLRCFGRVSSAFPEFIETLGPSGMTQQRREALTGMRNGLAEIIAGAMMSSIEAQTANENSELVLKELSNNSDYFSNLMTVDQRQTVISHIDNANHDAMTENEKDSLIEIKRNLSRTDCGIVCQL